MAKGRKRRSLRVSKGAGLPPGTAEYRGAVIEGAVDLQLFSYDAHRLVERDHVPLDEIDPQRPTGGVAWVNLDGLHQAAVVSDLCARVGVHPLIVEDILNPQTRPKAELDDRTLFLTLKMVAVKPHGDSVELDIEQMSVLLGNNWVFTFQERPGDALDPLRQRLRDGRGRARKEGAAYLAYGILDAVVDGYLIGVDAFIEVCDVLEDEVLLTRATADLPRRIHAARRELLTFRRAALPIRDSVGLLLRGESPLVGPGLVPFLRDLHDHLQNVIETLDQQRDRLDSALQLHLSLQNAHQADITRTLTVVATIFMPLTFVTGLYGMNFDHIPWIHDRWGFAVLASLMLVGSVTLLAFFRRRGWL